MHHLFHHLLVPLIYPNDPINKKSHLKSHFNKDKAQVTSRDYGEHTDMKAWEDISLARDILGRQSTSSSVHTWGNIVVTS